LRGPRGRRREGSVRMLRVFGRCGKMEKDKREGKSREGKS